MIPAIPRGARLGTGGEAAFRDATGLFQPTNARRVDSRAWRPSEADVEDRQDQGVFSPVGTRADASLWDLGDNAPGKSIPQALYDNSAGELGLSGPDSAVLLEDPRRRRR